MDEPMDDITQTLKSQINEAWNEKKDDHELASLLNSQSQCSTSNDYEYNTQYWPKLSSAVSQLMEMPANGCVPISYEQTYSCVYKSVCRRFSERLHHDLTSHISCFLNGFHSELCLTAINSTLYVTKFSDFLKRYLDAVASIVPIFNYMNKFYVQAKLHSNLDTELRQLFVTELAEHHVDRVLAILADALHQPFAVCPSVMSSIIRNLHYINPDFVKLKPQLFAKYVPNIIPPSNSSQLDLLARESQLLQRALHDNPQFVRCDMSGKRRYEDDAPAV